MTKTEAEKICNWCGLVLQLGGWDIAFYFQDETPEMFGKLDPGIVGHTFTQRSLRKAQIWVSPSQHDSKYDDIGETICHEMLHVFIVDRDIGIPDDSSENQHSSIYCLASILAKAYKAVVK